MTDTPISTEIIEEAPPEAPKDQPTEAATGKAVVPITKAGLFSFSNQQELANAASILMKMKLAPKHLAAEGWQAVAAAMVFCRQFNLSDRAMNEMAWIEGKLTQFGSLVQGLAERHPEYGEKEEFWLDAKQDRICAGGKNLGEPAAFAVCRVRPKTSTVWSEYMFSLDEAKAAGLYPAMKWDKIAKQRVPSPDSPWNKYTKDMMMHKARARALRGTYASALTGVHYDEDVREVFELDEPQNVGPHPHERDDVIDVLKGD